MAGAVSAGAYTAGVIDYFIEALELWEKAKQNNEPGTLDTEIVIDVLSGTSAGGMTALITAAALHREEFVHVDHNTFRNHSVTDKNPIFKSWIQLADEGHFTTLEKMCDTKDIQSNGNVPDSAFNSTFIDEIAGRLVNDTIGKGVYKKRSFVADDLQILVCMTNLRGFPVTAKFKANNQNDENHYMTQHIDFGHFETTQNGNVSRGRIPMNFQNPDSEILQVYKDVAMATGAFPLGLKPRTVTRKRDWILNNPFINRDGVTLDQERLTEANYAALMVDGGAFNNEPYDVTWELLDQRKKEDEECYVIMIDPIPSNVAFEPVFSGIRGLKNIAPKIIAALQAEPNRKVLKPDENRMYLISPARKGAFSANGNPALKKKENHIACGALNRFGGFFSKRFREHDYLLGRRNCKSFLTKHFKSADSTLIFPEIIFKQPKEHNPHETFEEQRTIPYPKLYNKKLLGFERMVKSRLDKVIPNLMNPQKPEKMEEQKKVLELYLGSDSLWQKIKNAIGAWFVGLILKNAESAAAKAFIGALTLDFHEKQQLTLLADEDADFPPTDAIGEEKLNVALKSGSSA